MEEAVSTVSASSPAEFASASTVIFQDIVFTVNYTRIIKETSAARLGSHGRSTRQLRMEREDSSRTRLSAREKEGE